MSPSAALVLAAATVLAVEWLVWRTRAMAAFRAQLDRVRAPWGTWWRARAVLLVARVVAVLAWARAAGMGRADAGLVEAHWLPSLALLAVGVLVGGLGVMVAGRENEDGAGYLLLGPVAGLLVEELMFRGVLCIGAARQWGWPALPFSLGVWMLWLLPQQLGPAERVAGPRRRTRWLVRMMGARLPVALGLVPAYALRSLLGPLGVHLAVLGWAPWLRRRVRLPR